MTTIKDPREMNHRFAEAFNARDIEQLMRFYEPSAMHFNGRRGDVDLGHTAIRTALVELLQLPGTMQSDNHFCIVNGDLALLRADWVITTDAGETLARGSSVEVARQQAGGHWLTVMDHAVGASLPPRRQ